MTRPISLGFTFRMLMRNGTVIWNGQHTVDRTLVAMQEMERYCVAHPGSPAAVRRPRLSLRGRTFVALLGPAIEEGIAGFGDSVQAALRAFDAQYSRAPRLLTKISPANLRTVGTTASCKEAGQAVTLWLQAQSLESNDDFFQR